MGEENVAVHESFEFVLTAQFQVFSFRECMTKRSIGVRRCQSFVEEIFDFDRLAMFPIRRLRIAEVWFEGIVHCHKEQNLRQ